MLQLFLWKASRRVPRPHPTPEPLSREAPLTSQAGASMMLPSPATVAPKTSAKGQHGVVYYIRKSKQEMYSLDLLSRLPKDASPSPHTRHASRPLKPRGKRTLHPLEFLSDALKSHDPTWWLLLIPTIPHWACPGVSVLSSFHSTEAPTAGYGEFRARGIEAG